MNDISPLPTCSYYEVCQKCGGFIRSTSSSEFVFQWEELQSEAFEFLFLPSTERFRMGRGSGLISRDTSNFFVSRAKPQVHLFDSTKKRIGEVIIDHECNNAKSQILSDDSLCSVTDDGFFYKIKNGIVTHEVDLRLDKSQQYVMDADFWDDGFCCLLTDGDLILIKNFKRAGMKRMANLGNVECPLGFFVIPPEKALSNQTTVFVLLREGLLYIVTEDKTSKLDIPGIIRIAPSASFSKIAYLWKKDEILSLSVVSSDFSKVIYTNEIEDIVNDDDIQNISWVGDAAPLICFKGNIMLVDDIFNDINGHCIWKLDDEESYPYGFTDTDSCLIITSGPVYRLRNTPLNVFDIFDHEKERNPARNLCIIYDNRITNPPIQLLGSFGDLLNDAAKDCADAAEYFSDIPIQQFFLSAACFAYTFLKSTKSLYDSIIRVKIINMIKNHTKIPITCDQIFDIGINALLDKLIARKYFNLAINISNLIHLPSKPIKDRYIDEIIKTTSDDYQCLNKIKEFSQNTFYYAAQSAVRFKRKELALEFCKLEPRFSKKALIYKLVEEWSEALNNAEESCDSSTMINVIDSLLRENQYYEAINIAIASNEQALMFIVSNTTFIKGDRVNAIMKLIDPKSTFIDAKYRAQINDSEIPDLLESPLEKLIIQKDNDSSKNTRISLPKIQEDLTTTKGINLNGMSFNETIRALLDINDFKIAFDVAKAVNYPRKTVAVIAIKHLSKKGRWSSLKDFISKDEWKELWPFVIHIAYRYNNEHYAKQFADEFRIKKKGIPENIDASKYSPSSLSELPSYHNLFRKNKITSFIGKILPQ